MIEDPIVNEVRKARDAHAKRFNYNLQEIYNDIKKAEKKHPKRLVTLPPKRYLKSTGT
jgi:DUF438 domain-containing protein